MKKLTIPFLIIIGLVLAGCNFPGFDVDIDEDPDDAMATEIAKILTGTPDDIEVTPTPVDEDIDPEVPDPTPTEPEEIEEPQPPTPTPEPTDTPTPMPTPTLVDTDPVQTLGNPDWVDNMANPNNWATGFSEFSTITFSDGYLKLTAQKAVDGWRLSWPVLGDFYLEATMLSPECEGVDHHGVIFRVPREADADRGYLFGISCDGRYSLRRWDSKNMVFLINRTSHDAINEGENAVNKLGIMARGNSIALYINGQKVNQVTDSTFLTGQFGIFVGGPNTEKLTVWVDQVRFWENP